MNANDYYIKYINNGEFDKYKQEAVDKACIDEKDIVKFKCELCGAKYKERPKLCICDSNIFLIECIESEVK